MIKYVLDKKIGLKLEQTGNANEPWEIVYFSDSGYAGDPASGRSISDILQVIGVPVSWQ